MGTTDEKNILLFVNFDFFSSVSKSYCMQYSFSVVILSSYLVQPLSGILKCKWTTIWGLLCVLCYKADPGGRAG
jgi:hypothetical protein